MGVEGALPVVAGEKLLGRSNISDEDGLCEATLRREEVDAEFGVEGVALEAEGARLRCLGKYSEEDEFLEAAESGALDLSDAFPESEPEMLDRSMGMMMGL